MSRPKIDCMFFTLDRNAVAVQGKLCEASMEKIPRHLRRGIFVWWGGEKQLDRTPRAVLY